jgi:hypothetical protein
MTDIPDTQPDIDLTGITHRGWDDVRGWLIFDNLPPEIQRQEDQTQNFDYERRHWRPSVHRTRPATSAEKLLLQFLGFNVPSDLQTVVIYPSRGIRRREWPALQSQLEGWRQ